MDDTRAFHDAQPFIPHQAAAGLPPWPEEGAQYGEWEVQRVGSPLFAEELTGGGPVWDAHGFYEMDGVGVVDDPVAPMLEALAEWESGAPEPGPAAAQAPGTPPVRHRRPGLTRAELRRVVVRAGRRACGWAFAATTALVVAVVSVLGALVSYGPLRGLAADGSSAGAFARVWPLLIYGPWLAAAMSILRAAVCRHRATHAWTVLTLSTTASVLLCVAHAPATVAGMSVAGLPPVTALACFHQLIRQIRPQPPARHAHQLPGWRITRGADGCVTGACTAPDCAVHTGVE